MLRQVELAEFAEPDDSYDPRLTPVQRAILRFTVDYMRRNSYAPTLQEIGDAAGLGNSSSASYQVKVLERKGYLRLRRGRPRAIEVVRMPDGRPVEAEDRPAEKPEDEQLAPVPLVGGIAAGVPILAHEDLEHVFPMPKQLVGEGELIMLRVRGDSMIGAAIVDGDLVVVRKESDVANGDIVAAMIDTAAGAEVTLKTFRMIDGHVWLMPHNPAYTPIDGDNATMVGKVVTVFRQLR
jgi:repressor LexA